MNISRYDGFIDENFDKAIQDMILNTNFFIHYPIEEVKTCMSFTHPVVARPENASEGDDRVRSVHVNLMVQLFELLLAKSGYVGGYDILRIAINATVASEEKETAIHYDHDYPHKQAIICLNDGFKGGATRIYDNDFNLVDRLEYEKYSAYIFDSAPHSVEMPTSGVRIVAVYTFVEKGNDNEN